MSIPINPICKTSTAAHNSITNLIAHYLPDGTCNCTPGPPPYIIVSGP
jgi:hypothetical protein